MITLEQLKALAHKAEATLGAEVHAFVEFVKTELGLEPADDAVETGSGSDDAGTTSASTDTANTDSGTTDSAAAPAADAAAAPAADAGSAPSAS